MTTTTVAGEELRQFVERYERIETEKRDAAEAQKEVMAEAKARGYCVKTLRKVIADRKKDRDALAEERALVELYETALEGK